MCHAGCMCDPRMQLEAQGAAAAGPSKHALDSGRQMLEVAKSNCGVPVTLRAWPEVGSHF